MMSNRQGVKRQGSGRAYGFPAIRPMALKTLRLVMIVFTLTFFACLYVTLTKLPITGTKNQLYVMQSWSERADKLHALQIELQREVQQKEQELAALIGNAVDIIAAGASEPETGGESEQQTSGFQKGSKEEQIMRRAESGAQNSEARLRTSQRSQESGASLGGRTALVQGGSTPMQVLQKKGHPILEVSEDQFLDMPLERHWARYAGAKGADNCEGDLGYGLLKTWRGRNQTYCRGHTLGDSQVQCFLMQQTHHHGEGDNLCVGTNVRMNFRELSNPTIIKETMSRYINTRHSDQAYVHFKKGIMAGTCEPETRGWKRGHFPGWNEDFVYNGFEALPPKGNRPMSEALECDVWVEHPVLVLQRDTFGNFFHDSEDFVNAWLAIAILGWNLRETQVYLTDLYPAGPFWDIWARVFGHKYPPKMAWDIKNEFGDKNVCFRKVAIGIYGPAAPTTLASFKTECERSSLVRAYSDTIIRGIGLSHLTHYAQEQPSKVVTVTWMARRASVIWPERNFCDSENSYFKCEDFAHLGTRSLGRMVRNDAQVVAALKRLEKEAFANGAQVRVQDVDFNLLSFEEQIKVDIQTDIMVGPHGAGLMHNIFMRDRAALLEVFVDGSGANKHFHNLAKWYGRRYVEMPSDNPVPTEQLVRLVRDEIARLDLSSW